MEVDFDYLLTNKLLSVFGGVNMWKAGHSDKRGVIIWKFVFSYVFFVHMCAHLHNILSYLC